MYHNADPIPQGTCTGVGSPCAQAGYALETRCHLGKSIVYDTVGKLGWKVDIRKHVIKEVITHVIEADVEGGWEDGREEGEVREVPEARVEEDCVVSTTVASRRWGCVCMRAVADCVGTDVQDCFNWEFGEFEEREDVQERGIGRRRNGREWR